MLSEHVSPFTLRIFPPSAALEFQYVFRIGDICGWNKTVCHLVSPG